MHGTIESVFRVEWRPLAELASIAPQWRDLAAGALEPNAFYEPAFALAAQPVFGRDVGAGLVWSRTSPPRLVGFFPARIERRRYGLPLPVLAGWTHPYGPLGTPLVERDTGAAVIAAWLDHVARAPDLPKLLLMPFLPTQGEWANAFDAALTGRARRSFGRHARAELVSGDGRTGYLDRAIGRRKRKELRRQRKRLMDRGVLSSGAAREPDAIANALDDFLQLEAAGWKGRAGSAARTHADLRKFMQTAILELAGEGKAEIDRLFVDTQPIAAVVMLRSGAAAWCWKIAYDEAFARYSPGVQLLLDATEKLIADPALARVDSCAAANHPMIDHVWRERLELADVLIRVGSGDSFTFAFACTLEALRRSAIAAAKAVRDRLRRH